MNRLAKEMERKGVGHAVDEPKAPAPAPITVTTEAEFQAALSKAPGQVLVDFSMEGCGACEDEAPKVQKLVEQCNNVTVIKVDVDQLSALADKFKVEGTPTLMYAATGADMTPEKAEEMADASAARRRIKCARK